MARIKEGRVEFMKNKYGYYGSFGRKNTWNALGLKLHRYPKFFLYILISFIGKLFGFSYPMFVLSDYGMISQIKENQSFEMMHSIKKSDTKEVEYRLKKLYIYNFLLTIASILIVGAFSAGLYLFFTALNFYSTRYEIYSLLISIVVAIIIISLIFIVKNRYFSILAFLVAYYPDIEFSEIFKIKKRFMSMISIVKACLITLELWIKILISAGIGAYFFYYAMTNFYVYWFVMDAFFIVIAFLAILTPSYLVYQVSMYELYNDIALEFSPEAVAQRKEIEIVQEKINRKDLLLAFFTEVKSIKTENVREEKMPENKELTSEKNLEELGNTGEFHQEESVDQTKNETAPQAPLIEVEVKS